MIVFTVAGDRVQPMRRSCSEMPAAVVRPKLLAKSDLVGVRFGRGERPRKRAIAGAACFITGLQKNSIDVSAELV